MKRFFLFLSLTIILFSLSACSIISVDAVLNLEDDEQWNMSFTFLLPGKEASILKLLDEDELMSMMAESGFDTDDLPENMSIDMKVLDEDSNGDIPLLMTLSGSDYASLNEMEENVIVRETEGRREILYFNMSGMSTDTDFYFNSSSFTLNANGKIIESNGEKLNDHSVIWHNFDQNMTATIELSSGNIFDSFVSNLNLGNNEILIIASISCCFCLAVIVIVVVVVLLVRNNNKKKESEANSLPPADSSGDLA